MPHGRPVLRRDARRRAGIRRTAASLRSQGVAQSQFLDGVLPGEEESGEWASRWTCLNACFSVICFGSPESLAWIGSHLLARGLFHSRFAVH
jgi:hypothetical protein